MYEAATENIDRDIRRRISQVLRLRKNRLQTVCHSNCILWGKKQQLHFVGKKINETIYSKMLTWPYLFLFSYKKI